MVKKSKQTGKTTARRKAIEIGAGVTTGIAAALVGGYLLYKGTGPQRKKAKAWVEKARAEAARDVKKLNRVGEIEYKRIVDKAMRHYGSLAKVNTAELAAAARDLKDDWNRIRTEVKRATANRRARARKPVQKKSVRRRVRK
jgi:hypothetical protein